MSTQEPINRSLSDKAMDRLDHALGRPLDPLGDTHRNFYSTGGALADEMGASPYWDESPSASSRLRYFHASDAGRAALAAHLREIGDQHRAFTVTYMGHPRVVIATTRDKAKYSHFLDISDVLPDLTFADYCRRTTVAAMKGNAR